MTEQLLTVAEAAQWLGCSERTLRRRIERRALPVFRDGRIVRIGESDLHAYIARRTTALEPARRQPERTPARRAQPPPVRSLFELPDPFLDPLAAVDLSSEETRKCPGGAPTPRGRQQGGKP